MLLLPWPLLVIDFEASSLEQDSYPIEVGLALWAAPEAPVLGWSTLIRPDWKWTVNGHWSAASARVHRICKDDLCACGHPPPCVAAALNAAVKTALGPAAIAWCDGGTFDEYWLDALFKVGGVQPTFTLGSWERLGPTAVQRATAWLEQTPPRHRARADAERLLLAVAHAAVVEVACGGHLAQCLPALASVTASDPDAGPNVQGP